MVHISKTLHLKIEGYKLQVKNFKIKDPLNFRRYCSSML